MAELTKEEVIKLAKDLMRFKDENLKFLKRSEIIAINDVSRMIDIVAKSVLE